MTSAEPKPVVRALLLDADGVTQHPRHGFLVAMARLGGPGLVRAAFAREKETITGKADLKEALAEEIAKRGAKCTPEQLIEIWCWIDLDQRMLDLVDQVRAQGLVVALATNQQSYRGTWMQQHLPYQQHFDQLFYSFEMGLAKPDPAYFGHIADALGLPAADCVMVDDLAANVRGAQQAGLQAVQFRPTDTLGQLRRKLRRLGLAGL